MKGLVPFATFTEPSRSNKVVVVGREELKMRTRISHPGGKPYILDIFTVIDEYT